MQLSFKTKEAALAALAEQQSSFKTEGRLPFEKLGALDQRVAELEHLNAELLAQVGELTNAKQRIFELEGKLAALKSWEVAVLVPDALFDLREKLVMHSIPQATGVYFLLRENVVVYVGQAVSVLRRVHDHLAEGLKKFDAVAWLAVPPAQMHRVEREWIQRLRPEYNIQDYPVPSK